MSLNQQNARALYLKNVLGIQNVILPKDHATAPAIGVTAPSLDIQFQTFNEGPFLFLNYKDSQDSLDVEEMQLLEKIIVALKIPFHKTSIATTQGEFSQISLESLKGVTAGFEYIFLLGEVWSSVVQLVCGEQRNIEKQIFYSTYDLKSLIENADYKKLAWGQFKQIMPELQKILISYKGLR